MKPEFMLIDWSRGSVVGCGSEDECREQLKKTQRNSDHFNNTYLLCEVKVMSEMKRVES
jgi:hypothetical protein